MWKIGDRVVVTDLEKAPQEDYGIEIGVGYKGTVIDFSEVGDPCNLDEMIKFLIQFDESINGHDGNGIGKVRGKPGHCWWMRGNLNNNVIKWRDNRYCESPLICKKIMKKRKNNFY